MKIGDRCQLNVEEAKSRGLPTTRWRDGKQLGYAGKIVGEMGVLWAVRWDGLQHARHVVKALIEREAK